MSLYADAYAEPKIEQMLIKLRNLQRAKTILEDEIKATRSINDSLQEELDTLQTEAYQLEGIHKGKEELCRVLQYQCKEMEQDSNRQLPLNRKSEELVAHFRCQIQETKLLHRKLRMRFENQLQQLIDQHKKLHAVYIPERLPTELETVENTKSQLLTTEQLKLTQLLHLEGELDEAIRQKARDSTETMETM